MLAGLVIWTLALSVFTAFLYVYDKQASIKNWRRISERTLLGCCLAGGWPGGLIVSQWARHKTIKVSYRVAFWVCVVANVSAVFLLMTLER